MKIKEWKLSPCPECGGQPSIETAQYGYAFYVLCGSCGWEGNLREIEATPFSALEHWEDKVANRIIRGAWE